MIPLTSVRGDIWVCDNGCSANSRRLLAGPGMEAELWEGRRPQGWGRAALGPRAPGLNATAVSLRPVDFLRNLFSQTLGLGSQKERLLDSLTLEGVARYMLSERCKSSRPCAAPFPPSQLQPLAPFIPSVCQ